MSSPRKIIKTLLQISAVCAAISLLCRHFGYLQSSLWLIPWAIFLLLQAVDSLCEYKETRKGLYLILPVLSAVGITLFIIGEFL